VSVRVPPRSEEVQRSTHQWRLNSPKRARAHEGPRVLSGLLGTDFGGSIASGHVRYKAREILARRPRSAPPASFLPPSTHFPFSSFLRGAHTKDTIYPRSDKRSQPSFFFSIGRTPTCVRRTQRLMSDTRVVNPVGSEII